MTDVAVSADPDLQANRRALADLDAEIARQSAQLGERHPQMINLREQQKNSTGSSPAGSKPWAAAAPVRSTRSPRRSPVKWPTSKRV